MVVGARRTILSVSRTATLLFFFKLKFPLVLEKNGPAPANLTQLWEVSESTLAGIPVERFGHLAASMLQ
jgi:hypothetical protein